MEVVATIHAGNIIARPDVPRASMEECRRRAEALLNRPNVESHVYLQEGDGKDDIRVHFNLAERGGSVVNHHLYLADLVKQHAREKIKEVFDEGGWRIID